MDAVRIMVKAEFDCEHGHITIGEYQKILDPLHDVEPIVRCEDCKYSYTEGFVHPHLICEKHPELESLTDNWFCADGVRADT